MDRNEQLPTRNEYGDDVHPAFGSITANRIFYGPPGAVLFDSDTRHGHTVRITLTRATRKRDLNRDRIDRGVQVLSEVEMSEAQWASFVSSMNTSGVPCTIRATESDSLVPDLPHDPRLAQSMEEVKTAAATTFGLVQAAMAAHDELPKTATAKEKRAAIDAIRNAVRQAQANLAFTAESMNKYAEDVVQRARADVEAMVLQKAGQLGLTPGQAHGLVELPLLDGETPAAFPAGDGQE